MPEESNGTSATAMSSRKQPKTGASRSRSSPQPTTATAGSSTGEQNTEGRPTKRARKAINCEPCRNSKLKCDRNRPCSSCVLRGTSALCYQDGRSHDSHEANLRGDDIRRGHVDPAQEIARIRHSLSLIESHLLPYQRNPAASTVRDTSEAQSFPKREIVDLDSSEKDSAPGMLGRHGHGGLYAGPTSAATHLVTNDSDDSSERQSQGGDDMTSMTHEYDRDLLALLPPIDVIDGLVDYYFEYCNWIYRHVNQQSFMHAWDLFKSGRSTDRIVLATACAIMAVAVYYLPIGHHLLHDFPETHNELGHRFYDVMRTALSRHQAESRTYTLDLVELLLIRCHYLTLSKTDSEEIWTVKGELLTIGTAMGLHRDPVKWRMNRDVAERRRWCWWHIILLERWQAFMFGRPISIAGHHFDTQMPSYCSPDVDTTGRLYLPNIALFRLATILGDIMNNAVSVRSIPYEAILENDRALTQWMDSIPAELDLDEFRVARSLASPVTAIRRVGVQSVIIRTAYYHIRFTLHRPYASVGKADPPSRAAKSLEIAVGASDKLITMVSQARPDFLANSSLAVPGHMNWGPFHCFSAAMFFSFQLIAKPDQPGAGLFRANIKKAMSTLEQARGEAVADKGYDILQALAPLHSVEFLEGSQDQRGRKKAAVLSAVRKLAFPYHDSPLYPRMHSESPGGRFLSSPHNSNSPGIGVAEPRPAAQPQLLSHLEQTQHLTPMSAVRTMPSQAELTPLDPYARSSPLMSANMQQTLTSPGQHQGMQNMLPSSLPSSQSSPSTTYAHHRSYQGIPQPSQFQVYGDGSRYTPYIHPTDEAAIWGASVGFGQSEWAQFLDVMRPEASSSSR